MLYHIFLFAFRDRRHIKERKKFKDPEMVGINELEEIPLLNIIIPAWKEGIEFKNCLISITKLSYPKIKIIINAGGNEETVNNANSFKKDERFIILHQKEGKDRAEFGKIKAINECLEYVSEGILYFIDADCYLTDEIILRVIVPIVNDNENVVMGAGIRPLKDQQRALQLTFLKAYCHKFFL